MLAGSYKEKKEENRRIAEIENYIKISKDTVPELSQEDAEEIQSFWKPYVGEVSLIWHKLLYAKTGIKRPDFVGKLVFNNEIRPYMNDAKLAGSWSDKAYLDYFIKDVKTPEVVVRNVSGRFLDSNFRLLSASEVQELLSRYDKLVIKPTVYTHTGIGVQLMEAPYDLKSIIDKYKKNYVIQLPIVQHQDMSRLNGSSVNTIRVNSVLFDTQAHIMSAFVKVGQSGQFADNSGSDRYFIGIDTDTGKLRKYAIDHDLQLHHEIPSGFAFADQPIPGFDRLKEAVCRAHQCIPHFGFAFWDVCVDKEGDPVIVEVNLRNPDSTIAQATGSPFLGEYTKQILEYIKDKKSKL